MNQREKNERKKATSRVEVKKEKKTSSRGKITFFFDEMKPDERSSGDKNECIRACNQHRISSSSR